jgi:hypothetical protein
MPQRDGRTSISAPFLSAATSAVLFATVHLFLVLSLAGQPSASVRATVSEVPTAQEILERSLKASEQNWKLSENYTWRETRFFRQKDKQGKVKEQESKTYDVTMIDGKEYERLIMEDGEPLPPEKERKEQAKLDKEVARLQQESPSQRARRLAKQKEEREEQERMFRAVPKAFRFQVIGEEAVDGRPAWVIAAMPREGFKPFNRPTSWLPKMKGKLWIDKQALIWLKAEVETLDTISFGLFLARVGKGSTMHFEQQFVNGEVWMPRRTEVAFDARLAIFKKLYGEAEILFTDYKKFSSDSKVVSTTVIEGSQE